MQQVQEPAQPIVAAAANRWKLSLKPAEPSAMVFRRWNESKVALSLLADDFATWGMAAFSPDGRYLAWGSQIGEITIADLDALVAEVDRFAAEVLPD